MSFRDRVLAYKHLGDSLMVVRAIFEEYGIDFEKEAARLNSKAPELAAGTMLREGAREAVDAILRQDVIVTPKGAVRATVFKSMAQVAPTVNDEVALLADLRTGIQDQYKRNEEERVAGAFAHILDCTVKEIGQLASRYRKIASSYYASATKYEWLVQEAMRRGLGENDTLRKAFTEDEVTAIPAPDENPQATFDFGVGGTDVTHSAASMDK